MNKQLSIYLDALRFLAAIAVYLSHIPGFTGGRLWQLGGHGHSAVIFFFVLSGFVISYVVNEKEFQLIDYAISRFARIYSVAIPAMIISIVTYYSIKELNPAYVNQLDRELLDPLTTIISAVFFINQSWREVTLFTNGPFWSLGYEVLFYVFFGILVFVTGTKKTILLAIIFTAMGPSVLIYLPIWYLGVFCQKLTNSLAIKGPTAALAYLLSIIGIILYFELHINTLMRTATSSFIGHEIGILINKNAQGFLGDYILSALIGVNITSFSYAGKYLTRVLSKIENTARECASYTFSIYLYHMPLMYFFSAIITSEKNPFLNLFLNIVAVPAIVIYLGYYTEKQKTILRRISYKAYGRFSRTLKYFHRSS